MCRGKNIPRAKKSLGQNFLRDKNIARRIVSLLDISGPERVLEIGPGPGALTDFILEAGPAFLLLVEKDPYWARERLQKGAGRLKVILADALQMNWAHFTDPWKFIGNLPYNIASPLLWEIFPCAPGLTRAVFTVQKEVGLRITAQPGTAAYGALSVWLQSFSRPKAEFIVPPQVFRPSPKVESMVLSFLPLKKDAEKAGGLLARPDFNPRSLARALHLCFQARRKQLGVILRGLGAEAQIPEELGLDPQTRPERLSPEDFQRLCRYAPFHAPQPEPD
ncbi:MAG: 16S rRNA (adenine(1518)-N(6)/adenine(1519)-N(6))-dimethyltransferase RsmA [Desulfovibrio sp.]|jgi:16S rRNA (adenine1518-N6/adenine1519-N6)-dimethyltransferase|nr:16S rRNA (adenine(1518)-N(6)/adenine(1519)-N(6))-dimethyltransferase RsmA [Desulfovibrio sp.]